MTKKKALTEFFVEETEKLASANGFVRAASLVKRFGAEIIARPLLVEAMLASRASHAKDDSPNTKWLILVDSERFGITETDIRTESSSRQLSARLRNTIAHEVVHSLSFRSTELGFSFLSSPKAGEATEEFVKRIERETEHLSPLLLVPESKIAALSKIPEPTVEDLFLFRSDCGISRELLINRFCLLQKHDPNGLLVNSSLENMAMGQAEWIDDSTARLLRWPLFVNFDRGRNPEFVSTLISGRERLISEITADPEFLLNGGTSNSTIIVTNALRRDADYMRMRVSLAIERTPPKPTSRFLFLCKKI